MCNLNQVFGGMQRYHYSCCRRKMHHIVATPCSCGRDRTMPESSELCCPLRCSRMAGSSNISAGSKRSSSKIQDPLRTTIQRRETNKSSNSSFYSQRSPIQTNSGFKGSMGNSVKTHRKSGGSAEVQKSKGPCICTICEEDALLSGCSSNCECDSTNSIFPTKSRRKNQGIKPRNSKSESQNADLKALVRAKPKRKKIVARKYPTRSTECPVERPAQESNDDDGVWFECNLPFRVNIPFPISMQSLFGLQPLRAKCNTQMSSSNSLVPANKLTQNGKFGSPFCLTMRNALPAPSPEPEPQPSTSKAATYLPKRKGLRRGKKRPCPCEISTQTGEEECDPVLCCLEQIRNQLAGKATEGQEKTPSRCFAEKSTNVTTLQTQKKAKEVTKKGPAKTSEEKPEKIKFEPPEIAEALSAASLESYSSESSQNKVVEHPSEIRKTEKKPKKTKSITSTTSLKKSSSKSSSKSSQNDLLKPPTKPKKAQKKPKKSKSIPSASSVQKSSSKSSQQEDTPSQEKLQKKEERESQAKKQTKSPKPRRKMEAKESQELGKNPEWIDPEEKVENLSQEKLHKKKMKSEADNPNKSSKSRKNVEEKKSKKPEWINPEPVRPPSVCFCGRPQVFPEYQSAMMQGSGYQPSCMYSMYRHNPMYQYPDHYHHQTCQCWQALEPEMPIYSSTESNKSASFNRNCTPEKEIHSSSSSDQEPNSQPQICQRSIMKRVSGESDQGVRDNRSNKSISFRGCACHNVRNSVGSLDKSKISDRTRNTNDGYNSPKEICQEDSNSNNSYDEQENKYESPERSNLRREFPPSRGNSRDRKYKAEEPSQTQKRARSRESIESGKKQSIDSLQRSSADSKVQKNNKKKRNSSPKSESLSRKTENPRSYGRNNKSKQQKTYDRFSSGGEFEEFDSITRVRKCSYDDQFYKKSGTSPMKHSPVELPYPSQGVDQACSLNTEIKSGSGLTSKNKISQECYFPLNDKTPQPIRSLTLQEKIGVEIYPKENSRTESNDPTCSQSIRSNGERSLSNQISLGQDEVINTNEYQSNSSKSSDKMMPEGSYSGTSRKIVGELKTMDNISYNQKNSRDIPSEDQISRSPTNRSFSIISEAFDRAPVQAENSQNENISLQYSDETQGKSHNWSESIRTDQKVSDTESQRALRKIPNGSNMNEEMASQNSENPLTKVRSSTGSINTEDIYESPSTSCKSSEIFDSRLIYSQFKRPSSEKRFNLNQITENRENISQDGIERNSRKSCPIDHTRPVSGMDMQSNDSQYLKQTENWQKSPTINRNGILVNKKKRSQSAPPCLVLQYGENRPEREFLHRRRTTPKNQFPREFRTLLQSTENVLVIQDESCSSEMEHIFPTERLRNQRELEGYRMAQFPLQKGDKDISVRLSEGRTPDYSINYSIMQGNQQVKEESCFIPRQVQERTPMPGFIPEYMQQGSPRPRQNPPMVLVPFRMESREVVNVCQPDEWRELRLNLSMVSPNQLQMAPGRSQPRKLPTEQDILAGYHSSSQYRQNTLKAPYVRNFHNNNILRTRRQSNASYSQSEAAYLPPCHLPFSRPNQPEENKYRKFVQRRSTLASRQRRPSYTSVSQSEEGYVSHSRSKTHVERMEPTASKNSHKLSIASVSSSPRSSATRSSKSSRHKATGNPSPASSRSISFNHQAKEKRDIYAGNRNKAGRKLGGNSEISICRSDCRCYIGNQVKETLSSNSGNQTSICQSDCRCYIANQVRKTLPTNSRNQTSEFSGLTSKGTAASFQSEKTTDVETLETVTLLHPRRLRSNESTRVRTQDRDIENTVLLEIRTTCKKDNLIQTCGRPPCNFSRQHYTGSPPIEVPVHSRNYQRLSSRVPQNGNPYEENYLMRSVNPPTSGPAPGYQQRNMLVMDPHQSGRRPYHHFPIPNPGYYPEPLREKIKALPEGFYDETINKYNIIRMDSDFQPPPLGPEIIQVIKAHPQFCCGRTGCPIQRQIMPQNQFYPGLPNQPPSFCPQPNVKLDGYDQSESQF